MRSHCLPMHAIGSIVASCLTSCECSPTRAAGSGISRSHYGCSSLHPLVSKPAFNLHASMPVESKPWYRSVGRGRSAGTWYINMMVSSQMHWQVGRARVVAGARVALAGLVAATGVVLVLVVLVGAVVLLVNNHLKSQLP